MREKSKPRVMSQPWLWWWWKRHGQETEMLASSSSSLLLGKTKSFAFFAYPFTSED